MATIRTTAKRNPITGNPAPAYTKGKQSNFAGTDRKREPEYMQVNTRDRMNAEKQANKDLNKSLNAGIPTKGQMRRGERSKITEAKKFERKYRRSRGIPSKFEAAITKAAQKTFKYGKYDTGGKKNMDGDKSNRQTTNAPGQRSQNKSCKIKMRK
jgi:hypothetical protein